ncbi:MAG: tetratricopeptide repeat protein [Caulobacteraceae bacterium]|nr:tetratricopeptide repeat protein [Caulobacter sp.]
MEEVAEGGGADGRERLFFARSSEFDARALYGAPWNDADHLARDWRTAMRRRTALCEAVGARFAMLIAPDAHAVHADELPPELAFAEPSVADRFAELFAGLPGVNLIHPREALRAARGPVDLYQRTDSHWTSFGAYAAYRMLMERVGAGARVLGPDEVRFGWREEVGDLGWVFDPPRRAAHPVAEIVEPRARSVLDRRDEGRGGLRVFEVDDSALPTCLVFRDSFATSMAPFLAESFRRTVVIGADDRFFPEALFDERPDVVIVERAERALPFGVIDWGLATWREQWPEPGADPAAEAADAQARRLLGAGDAAAALACAEQAVAAESTADRLFTLGRTRLQADDAAGAADAFAAALELEPSRWAFALHLGIAFLRAQRLAEARDLFARCCALAPWHPVGFEHFGYASLALGDLGGAEPALRTAIRLGPELAGGWVWLVHLLRAAGRAEEAQAVACAGGSACPNDATLQALAAPQA